VAGLSKGSTKPVVKDFASSPKRSACLAMAAFGGLPASIAFSVSVEMKTRKVLRSPACSLIDSVNSYQPYIRFAG